MANRRQIPFLHWHTNADGSETAWWKPSPRLRRLGWQNRKLGTRANESAVMLAALELNRQLAEWEAAGRGAALAAPVPRRRKFADLLEAYRASADFTGLREATRREYEVRMRALEIWALDGKLDLAHLDAAMVADLKAALLADGGSLHRAAAMLRVLRLLLNWAIGQRWIAANATDRVKIPTPPTRKVVLIEREVAAAVAAAEARGWPLVALGMQLGFWSFQREADLLALNRFAWRPLDDVEPADAAVLANRKGDVMGFRLQQQKTGKWVDCPMPPWLHDVIENAFADQLLLRDDARPARACPVHLFQRRARESLNDAGLPHAQFRDLRRSGMVYFRDLGVNTPGITAISGHAIMGHKTIMDTYMPGNTRAACAAMASALRTRAARIEREQAQ